MSSNRKKRHAPKDLINRDPDSQFRKKLLDLFRKRQAAIMHLNRQAKAFDHVIEIASASDDSEINISDYRKSVSECNRDVSIEVVAVEEIDRDIANLLNEWDAHHRWEDNDASGK